jgi:methylase of polypeptide subunit release factors
VSNPPYIAADEMAGLAPEVRDWEPHLALTPGGDGLDAYPRHCARGGARLMPGGRLMVEIGPTQGQAVAALFAAEGCRHPHPARHGRPRPGGGGGETRAATTVRLRLIRRFRKSAQSDSTRIRLSPACL